MKKILFACAALLAMSCVKEAGMEPETAKVPVSVGVLETKTVISGNQISFSGNESMTLVCEGVNAAKVSNIGTALNRFTGAFDAVGQNRAGASFYAIYPYVGVGQNGDEAGWLPVAQTAPFDGSANFMCSDKVTADYDEQAMPELSMQMNQLMGIIKVTFTNSSETFKDDVVKDVILSSSTQLVGSFVVKFDEAGRPAPAFRGDDAAYRRVIASYPSPVVLGMNQTHEVHLFVNPAEIKDAEITIITDKHEFTRKAAGAFTAKQGDLTYMDPMDVATTFTAEDLDVKTLVVWGDSYTNRSQKDGHVDRCNYVTHLHQMLGSGWEVYNGGSSGDVTNTIAARQGGIQLVINSTDFTVPAGTEPVAIDGLYSSKNFWFTDGEYTLTARFALVNPLEIVVEDASGNEVARVEGNVTIEGDKVTHFTRTTPGEEIKVPAYSKVVTFAAKNLRNPDLMIVYMGQNGGFKSLDILYNQYRSMIDYAFPEGPEDYIVLGFHNHDTVAKWNVDNAYWDFFGGASGFGVNEAEGRPISRFVNLYTELTGPDYKDYLVISGAAASVDDVRAEDIDYVSRGMIPYSYWIRPWDNDIHPNEYGAKAFAAAVYKKVVELGYVE